MKKLGVLFIGLLILSGCATTTPMVWYKSGASQEEYSRDRYNCLREAQQPVTGSYVNRYAGESSGQIITNNQLYSACMNAKGWFLEPSNPQQVPLK